MATQHDNFFPLFSQLHKAGPNNTASKKATPNDLLVREHLRRERVELLLNSRKAAEQLVKALPPVVRRKQLSTEAIANLIAESFFLNSVRRAS